MEGARELHFEAPGSPLALKLEMQKHLADMLEDGDTETERFIKWSTNGHAEVFNNMLEEDPTILDRFRSKKEETLEEIKQKFLH